LAFRDLPRFNKVQVLAAQRGPDTIFDGFMQVECAVWSDQFDDIVGRQLNGLSRVQVPWQYWDIANLNGSKV
jgi:hypothetical protein